MADEDARNVARVTVDILVADLERGENLLLPLTLFLEDFQSVRMLLGVVNFLESAKLPILIFVGEVVKFDQVATLDKILLGVKVVELGLGSSLSQFLGRLLRLLLDQGFHRLFLLVLD